MFGGRFKVGEISIVEVVHFLIFGIPLDIVLSSFYLAAHRFVFDVDWTPEASRALQSHAAEGGG